MYCYCFLQMFLLRVKVNQFGRLAAARTVVQYEKLFRLETER